MSQPSIGVERFRKVFLLSLVALISIAFLYMIRPFITTLLLAAIISGLCHPAKRRLAAVLSGRESIAASLIVITVFVLIIGPMLGFLGLVAGQALDVVDSIRPWIEARVEGGGLPSLPDLPIPEALIPYEGDLLRKAGELAGEVGRFLVGSVASATRGTATFLLSLFLMGYAMFFFLRDGHVILDRILYYMPLGNDDEARLVGKFVSVARATIKGTLVVGIVQGGLAGAAFAVVGIEGAAFWGTVMAILSIIPGVGAALVWVPAAIILFVGGRVGASVGLTVWCVAVVGTVDNVLRPMLVGRDTQMSDLLILLSTLGGLLLFGAMGIVIGPILAALFVTIWEIYGEAFSQYLPETGASAD